MIRNLASVNFKHAISTNIRNNNISNDLCQVFQNVNIF